MPTNSTESSLKKLTHPCGLSQIFLCAKKVYKILNNLGLMIIGSVEVTYYVLVEKLFLGITKLENPPVINTQTIENLFKSDLAYLQTYTYIFQSSSSA
jgi:hypothetical protein